MSIHLKPGDVFYDYQSGCTVRLMTEDEHEAIRRKCLRGIDHMVREAKIAALIRAAERTTP